MGGSQSNIAVNLAPGSRKKIVVIGGSFGGKYITNMLQQLDPKEIQFEVLIIDKNEHFEYICANFASLADENAWAKNTIKFTEAIKSYDSSRVTFKQGKLCNVLSDKNQVEIETLGGQKEMVPFDCLIIATGASYVSPWRGKNVVLTNEEREAEVSEVRKKIKAAKSILCVGAGPTGLETAGYLKEKYPGTKIGICQRGPKLLPAFEGASDMIRTIFKTMDI